MESAKPKPNAIEEPLYVTVQNYIRTKPRKVLLAWAVGILAALIGTNYILKKYRRKPRQRIRPDIVSTPSASNEDISKRSSMRTSSSYNSLSQSFDVSAPVDSSHSPSTLLIHPPKTTPTDTPTAPKKAPPPSLAPPTPLAPPAVTQTVLTTRPAERKSTVQLDRASITRPTKSADTKKSGTSGTGSKGKHPA